MRQTIDLENADGWKPAAGHIVCGGDCGPTPPIDVTAWLFGPSTHEDGFFKEERISLRLKPLATGTFPCTSWGTKPNAVLYMNVWLHDDVTPSTPRSLAYEPLEVYESTTTKDPATCSVTVTEFGEVGGWVVGSAKGSIVRDEVDSVNSKHAKSIKFEMKFRVPRLR